MLNRKPTAPRRRAWVTAALSAALAAGAAACGPPAMNPDANNADATPDGAGGTPVVHLNVDSNRDGMIQSTDADRAHRAEWSTTFGAMYLANVDDDDSDQAVDALDETVNGTDDERDLARIQVEASPGTPMSATGSLALDGPPDGMVRLFKHGADGSWTVFTPGTDMLTGAELRAGVEFGIESKDFPTMAWDGTTNLTLTVTNNGAMVGTDRVSLRVAPWVMGNSLAPTEYINLMYAAGLRPSDLFERDLSAAAMADNMMLVEYDAYRTEYLRMDPNGGGGPDVWTQDIMEFGWSAIPGPGGMPQGMYVVLRSPPADRPATRVTELEILGPGMGYVWKHTTRISSTSYDESLDSFGNLELIPPYTNGDQHYPLGRIMYDYTPGRYSDPALRAFLDAQHVQGPVMQVDGSWLLVGHVDELFSYVPAPGNSRHGWKLLITSPSAARQMLQNLVTMNAANGDVLMFQGQYWYDQNPDGTVTRRAAQRTINSILMDTDLMAFNQQVQAHVDMLRMQIQHDTGIPDSDIIEIPFLWEQVDMGRALAYQPGTVNLLLYNGTHAVIAKPHGPVIGGMDAVQADMTQRMMMAGVTPHFAEQWDLLHALEGEVHCGTNAVRRIPTDVHWWEVGR